MNLLGGYRVANRLEESVESIGGADGGAQHVLLAVASQVFDGKMLPQTVGRALRTQQANLCVAQIRVHSGDRRAIVRVIPQTHHFTPRQGSLRVYASNREGPENVCYYVYSVIYTLSTLF